MTNPTTLTLDPVSTSHSDSVNQSGPCTRRAESQQLGRAFGVQNLNDPVGRTVATRMSENEESLRDLEPRVLEILQFVMEADPAVSLSGEPRVRLRTYMESIVWVFVARMSATRQRPHEKDRMQRSLVYTRVSIEKLVDDANSEMSLLKYWFNRYMCDVFDVDATEYPPALDKSKFPRSLFSGWCKKYISRAVARRDLAFIYSLSKGSKLAWPPLTRTKQQKEFRSHADRLSRAQSWDIPIDLIREVERTSKEIFRSVRSGSKFLPSGSACLQANRREGGALSTCWRVSPEALETYAPLGRLRGSLLALNNWRVREYRRMHSEAVLALTPDPSDPETIPGTDVRASGVCEPGKLRIVTVGDGNVYSALQPLQGEMLAAWKKTPYSSMLYEDLTGAVSLMVRRGHREGMSRMVSGDFEAATDWLSKTLSLAALSGVRRHPLYHLAHRSLRGGSLSYPEWTGVESVAAYEGQLMGHPLSFPLLCVVNLAVYRCACRRWVDFTLKGGRSIVDAASLLREYEHVKENVLVNGDDILFMTGCDLYSFWRKATAEAGLRISAGKNYVSTRMCQMNSQVFKILQNGALRVGYLNQRFLTGVNVKTGVSECTPDQLGKELSKMVRLCPWSACGIPKVFRRWSGHWLGRFRPNWYLPVHLGGFGLDPSFGPTTVRVTREQRLMAARFISDPRLTLYRKVRGVKSAEFLSSRLRFRFVPGATVLEEGTTTLDEWVGPLLALSRAVHGSENENSDSVVQRRFRPEYRLKPMSLETVLSYWTGQFVVPRIGEPPAYAPLPMVPVDYQLQPVSRNSIPETWIRI